MSGSTLGEWRNNRTHPDGSSLQLPPVDENAENNGRHLATTHSPDHKRRCPTERNSRCGASPEDSFDPTRPRRHISTSGRGCRVPSSPPSRGTASPHHSIPLASLAA